MAAGISGIADWLKRELERRQRHNVAYSMRAFARDLKISPATLSGLLAEKRSLRPMLAARIAKALELSPTKTRELVRLAKPAEPWSISKLARKKGSIRGRSKEFSTPVTLIDPLFQFARNLIETDGFKSNPEWMANRLGVTKQQIDEAMTLLHKCGMISIDNQHITLNQEDLWLKIKNAASTDDMLEYQKRIIDRVTPATKSASRSDMYLSNLSLSLDPELIPQAKEAIRDFMHTLARLLESGNKKEVYSLTVHLLPVTGAPRTEA